MANTFKKVHLHIVFAVKNRDALLNKKWRPNLFSYISGIIKKRGHYPLAVNGYNDHIHILLDYNLNEIVPDLLREIKKSSCNYIKDNNLSPFHFQWQSGYAVFSVGHQEVYRVIEYIKNQEKHHASSTFKNEYQSLLNEYEVEYKDKYLFDFLD